MPDEPAALTTLAYSADADADARPERRLSLLDSVCIIVGVIIGSGIFQTTGGVAAAAKGGVLTTSLFWLAGGAVSLLGALCYAELSTAYPKDGGEYVFLSRAFGRPVGLLFAWCGFWIVRPGNIGAMAYVFAAYGLGMLAVKPDLHPYAPLLVAGAAVVALTLLNLAGLRAGRWTQNLLTAAKVLGIVVVIAVAFPAAPMPQVSPAGPTSGAGAAAVDYRLALIMVLFSYGGWNEISYVAAEVRDPRRQFFRALVGGVLAVTGIYLLFSDAQWRLSASVGMRTTPDAWLAGLVQLTGRAGLWLVSVLVCLSSLGSMQGMIFAGSRIYYAVGADYPAYRWLGHWNPRHGGGTPVHSLLLQGAVTLALVIGFGFYPDGFNRMLIFTTPVFYLFFLLATVSLFVLRRRDRDVERPFRVPLYPVTPILFAASCAFMLWASLKYAWEFRRWEALWSIVLLLAGVIASLWTARLPSGEPRA